MHQIIQISQGSTKTETKNTKFLSKLSTENIDIQYQKPILESGYWIHEIDSSNQISVS